MRAARDIAGALSAVLALILIAIFVALVASLTVRPVEAHHVETADTDTDAAAFAVYLTEYNAQKQVLIEAYMRYVAATSAMEKADEADRIRQGLVVTSEHLQRLERPCFDVVSSMVAAEFDAIIAAFSIYTTNPILFDMHIAQAGRLSAAMIDQVPISVIECAPEAT